CSLLRHSAGSVVEGVSQSPTETEGGHMRATFRIAHPRYIVPALVLGTIIAAALLSPVRSASTQAVPGTTVPPAITGSAAVGQTLTTSDGTWSGSPTSFTYEWLSVRPRAARRTDRTARPSASRRTATRWRPETSASRCAPA